MATPSIVSDGSHDLLVTIVLAPKCVTVVHACYMYTICYMCFEPVRMLYAMPFIDLFVKKKCLSRGSGMSHPELAPVLGPVLAVSTSTTP